MLILQGKKQSSSFYYLEENAIFAHLILTTEIP